LVAISQEESVLMDRRIRTAESTLVDALEAIKGEVHVHLESSELAGWVQQILRGRVISVVASHPKSNAWIAKDPLKRDRLDARKLAHLLRMNLVHEVYYPPKADRALFKQVVQHYDDVTQQQVRLKQKIKARLRAQGVITQGKAVYSVQGRQGVLQQVRYPTARAVLKQLYVLLDETLQQQHRALELMRKESQQYPEIQRFQEVPGVGLISACQFSAYVQTPHRFSNKRKLWRYSQLGITDRSSDGKPLGRKRLDRNGNGRLKKMTRVVFTAAMRTKNDNAFRRTYQATLSRTHESTHARLTVQRKVLSTLRAMWKGETRYCDKPTG
jgi:transposase